MEKPATGQPKVLIAHYRGDTVSGAERSIADFCAQASRSFAITMLIPEEGRLADFYRKKEFDIWVRKIETKRRMFPGLHEVQSFFAGRRFQKKGIDVVVANTFSAASRVVSASEYAGLPRAVYVREYVPKNSISQGLLNRFDRVFCISKDIQRYLSDLVEPQRLRLTYNFINPEPILDAVRVHREDGRRLLPFPTRNPVIGLIGRITPFKQQEVFIRSVPLVLQAYPEARFVIVGAARADEKAYEESLHSLARELGIQDRLIFMGNRKDAVEITSELAVSCLTSDREPLGRVILEAALIGIPVVVPDSGGPAEIIEQAHSGLQFHSTAEDAHEALSRCILRILTDEKLAKALSQSAKESVTASFASQKPVENQINQMKELINSK